jgi:hypothetical protein
LSLRVRGLLLNRHGSAAWLSGNAAQPNYWSPSLVAPAGRIGTEWLLVVAHP